MSDPPLPPNNLPLQLTSMVGRKREIDTACKLLRSEEVRLLTLTGAPGVGKTRLALQAARGVLTDFPHGGYFVNLAHISDQGLVVPTISQVLGIKQTGDQPLLDVLKYFLSGKRILLVLDNFEQVMPAGPQIAELLLAAPGLKVLVTSREMLHLSGEHDFPVPPLSLPPLSTAHEGSAPLTGAAAERLAQFDAVQLFLQRAEAVKPDFTLADDNAVPVAEICRRLDGLPLAIELAAARIRHLPPHAMLERLQSRLSLLTGGARNLPDRHQTLRAAIEWSHSLLDEPEQRLFRRLAVFRGGCTLEAVETVCNTQGTPESDPGPDILDVVASLLDKSLLKQEAGPSAVPRLSMLETIHEYAMQTLAGSHELEATQRAHAGYFLMLTEDAEPQLHGPQSMSWLDRLEAEHDNLRAALRWTLGATEDEQAGAIAVGLRLACALSWFWEMRGYITEGREWMALALSRAGVDKHGSERIKALTLAGRLAWKQSDLASARSLLEESLATSRRLGDQHAIASSEHELANVINDQGDLELARSLWEQSLSARLELGDTLGSSRSLYKLGVVAYELGDYAHARAHFEQSLEAFRELGDKWAAGYSLEGLGRVAHEQGDYASARAFHERSLATRVELGDKPGIASSLAHLARSTYAQGDSQRAVRLAGAAQAIFLATGVRMEPGVQSLYEQELSAARKRLGGTQFSKLFDQGRAMTIEEAVADVLAPSTPEATGAGSQSLVLSLQKGAKLQHPEGTHHLTAREREIAALIAEGKTNREIADTLVVGERTVEWHTSNILSKLGLQSRAQIAVWAVERRVTGDR